MAAASTLTVRFTDGHEWSCPFEKGSAEQVFDSLRQATSGAGWLFITGPGEGSDRQLLCARASEVQSVLWQGSE